MTKKNDGGPAFPIPVVQPFGDGVCAIGGMSLRQYYAGQADIPWEVAKEAVNRVKIGTASVDDIMRMRATMKFGEADYMIAAEGNGDER